MVHGVAKKSGRGLPKCIIQDEVTNKNLQAEVRGTTKAAVLEGDNECPNIVAFSVYDKKQVNFLSTACHSLHEYNYGMNNVDQAWWLICM